MPRPPDTPRGSRGAGRGRGEPDRDPRPPCCRDSGDGLCPQHDLIQRQRERELKRQRNANPGAARI